MLSVRGHRVERFKVAVKVAENDVAHGRGLMIPAAQGVYTSSCDSNCSASASTDARDASIRTCAC
jgi:hypothetical protein